MSLDKIFVLIASVLGSLFTFWFFLMRKEETKIAQKGTVDILVNGGYKPDRIIISLGKTTTINFLRIDPSNCLEEVVLSDFNIKRFLPLNKKISIEITPREKGVFRFSCGMNMFHGKLVVK